MGKNKTQEKTNDAQYNFSPPADQCQTRSLNLDHSPFQVILPVYILGMTFHGLEYPLGQFVSPVPTMLSLPAFFVYLLTGGEWDTKEVFGFR